MSGNSSHNHKKKKKKKKKREKREKKKRKEKKKKKNKKKKKKKKTKLVYRKIMKKNIEPKNPIRVSKEGGNIKNSGNISKWGIQEFHGLILRNAQCNDGLVTEGKRPRLLWRTIAQLGKGSLSRG